MDLILPHNTNDREYFCKCAMKVGFHEFVALKVLYTMKDSDLDVFQVMARERLDLILYGWELCQVHWDELTNKDVIPPHLYTVLKQLTRYSLDIWFSNEWENCTPRYKAMLMVCLKRAADMLTKLADDEIFDWSYTLKLGVKPWDIPYLRKFVTFNSNLGKKFKQSSEHVEAPATTEDIEHLKKEGLVLLLLRLVKLFDAGFIEGVRKLSMRIIAAWNHEYEQCKLETNLAYPEINDQHKRCLILICHIYMMAIYEIDDIRGFVIDNLLNNIRFYYENMLEETNTNDQTEYTPARYIVITCINLQISCNEFIDAFIYNSFDESFVSLFGVISQSYLSYLLGNLLMEMNKMNEDDFSKHIEDFKRIIHLYIKERERSEEFIMGELHKKELKRRSHTTSPTKDKLTNFYDKMCKGNRLSNIGSTEHTEEDEKKCTTTEEENERRVDPIFQHLPNNEEVLNYVYTILVKRGHRGWYFAKLIVLLKIIWLQLNALETWRYHPGLTPEFLLNLEVKLSRHFEDLAVIFQEHLFMEQEFWLTGFYLNPCKKYYETVIRSGMRSNRLNHRFETGDMYDDDERYDNRRDRRGGADKTERVNAINAKYGLLSSTMDVKEIVKLANHEAPDVDYGQLCKALRSFKLPENTIKDLLTVIFLPRHKNFSWALNWVDLRKRCKSLLKDNEQKRHFVELNMAEANDRLAFLNVDYEKYKHRPQLDYGSIERGYESSNMPNFNKDSSDENEDEDSEDFEADSDLDDPAEHEPKKKDHSQLFDSYFMSTRRTRARAAAMIADVLENETREEKEKDDAKMKDNEKGNGELEPNDIKHDLNEIMKERKVFDNSTSGFNPFPDIWNVNIQYLDTIEEKLPYLETGSLFQKSAKLELLKNKSGSVLEPVKEWEGNKNKDNEQMQHEENDDQIKQIQKDNKNMENKEEGVKENKERNGEQMRIKKNDKQMTTHKHDQQMENLSLDEEQKKNKEKHNEPMEVVEKEKDNEQIEIREKMVQKGSQPTETQNANNESITDIDMHDDDSDVSTTARRDSDEVNDISKDEQMDQSDDMTKQCSLIKERVSYTERRRLYDTDKKPKTLESPRIKVEVSSEEHQTELNKDNKESESSRTEQEELLKRFTQKKLCVRLRRLRVADVQNIRQPSVRLERMDLETVTLNRLGTLRRAERKFYTDMDESSKSSNSSLSNQRTVKKSIYCSESSTESDEFKQKRRVGRPTRGRIGQSGSRGAKASNRTRTENLKSLKVTPRSASGLKFRISTNEKAKKVETCTSDAASNSSGAVSSKANKLPIIDYIQISSSSSSEDGFGPLITLQEDVEMNDPLYEEEIPLFRI